MNRFRLALLGAVLVAGLARVSPGQTAARSAEPLTLAALEALALEKNPTLAQAAAEIEAARGRALQAGKWPNPVVGYTGEEISKGPVIRGGEHGFFVEQTLPISGNLRLSRAVFQHEVVQAEGLAEAQRLRVLTSVRILFYQALIAARRVEVDERLAQLTREAVGVSAQLFNVGAADRPDVLEAEIEERRTQIDVTAARNAQFRVWRRLAAVVGDPALELRPLVGSFDAALPQLERQQLLETTLRDSPEIKAARAGIERAAAALRRARRDPVPDLVVRGGPRYNRELLEPPPPGGRPVGWEATLEIGITLPLFNRNQGNVRAAQAELARAQGEVRRLELGLGARFAEVFDDYLTALRSAEVYRAEITPRADQAYQLHLARFREMAASYPQVLVAQRTLVQVNERYLESLEATWRAATQLQGFLLMDGLQPPGRPGEVEPAAPGLHVEAGGIGGVRPGRIQR